MDDDMKLPAKNNGAESDHTMPGHPMHAGAGHGTHRMGTGSHSHDLVDFKKRFIVSTVLTVPILLLSPVIQSFFGFRFDVFGTMYISDGEEAVINSWYRVNRVPGEISLTLLCCNETGDRIISKDFHLHNPEICMGHQILQFSDGKELQRNGKYSDFHQEG